MSNNIIVVTQTQSGEVDLNSDSKTKCFPPEKRADSLYGVMRKKPNKVLVSARKEAGRDKTSIECAVGQREMFKQLMAETNQKREREWNPSHDKVVANWSALFPKPKWDVVLGKRKRCTKQKMYVADMKKQKVDQEMSELAARYYEYDN